MLDCLVPKPGMAASLAEFEEVHQSFQIFWVVVVVVVRMEEVV